MVDEQPRHALLWRRVRAAISACGLDADGNPIEVADRMRAVIGGDYLDRFLKGYYLERQYAGGRGTLSDAEAEALVHEIEARLSKIRAASAAHHRNSTSAVRPGATPVRVAPEQRSVSVLEEAEAYGEAEAAPFSIGNSIRAFLRERREKQATARAEKERNRQKTEEQARQRELARAREEEERRRREVEAEEARAVAQQRAREAAELAHARRLARELEVAEKQRREVEERQAQELSERRQAAADRSRNAADAVRAGERRAATVLLEEVTALFPNDAAGWFALAWSCALDSNYRRSTEYYTRGLSLEPNNKIAWNNLGRDQRRRRRFKDSAKALAKALEIDPEYVTALANLGATQRESGDYRGAAASFGKVVARAPNDSAAWFWLGVCHQHLREYTHAERAFARAVELDASIAEGWWRLGDCLRALKRKAEARRAYERAGSFAPPRGQLGILEFGLTLGTVALSYAGAATQSDALALATIAAFCITVWRLALTRVQLFVVAMPATAVLALPFTEHFDAAPVAVAALFVYTAVVGKLWRRFKS